MRSKKYFILLLACLCLIAGNASTHYLPHEYPVVLSSYTAQNPASLTPLIKWQKNTHAVYYEIELFDCVPAHLSPERPSKKHIFFCQQVYTNAFILPLDKFLAPGQCGTFYWRVRAMDFDQKPITPFSPLKGIYCNGQKAAQNAPIPIKTPPDAKGNVLLYPVYHWIPNNNAEKFEVEILSAPPENPHGIKPSRYRVFSAVVDFSCEYYDPKPRIGTFYWRVRALDGAGNPVGTYCQAQKFTNDPKAGYTVGIYGDSISHGGGHMSYSPADLEFSYAHYLDFPTVNLSQSGDTIGMLVNRFDNDVLPFSPRYLFIMGGTNSLRAGESAEDVIDGLKILQQKCRQNGIVPILLTLPSINPSNIKKIFGEPTEPGWQERIEKVNAYIRTQDYLDTAAAFPALPAVLPTKYALDGLHPDDNGKARMAKIINRDWPFLKEKIAHDNN